MTISGHFALLECIDYPFYDTVDVDFYASFALLALYPELELRGIRDLLAAISHDDPEIVTIEASGLPAPRKVGGTVPHDVGGPDDDPFVRPNWYRFQDVNDWKDLGPKFVLQVWRDALAAAVRRATRSSATPSRPWSPSCAASVLPIATTTACPSTTACPTRRTTPGRCTGRRPTAGRSGWPRSLRPRRWRGVSATRAGEREWAGWFERGQVAFDRRLWRGTHYAYDDGGGPSSDSVMADQLAGQWYADATGLGTIVPDDRVETALRTVLARNVRGFGGGRMGAVNGTRPDGWSMAAASSRPRCGSGRPTRWRRS